MLKSLHILEKLLKNNLPLAKSSYLIQLSLSLGLCFIVKEIFSKSFLEHKAASALSSCVRMTSVAVNPQHKIPKFMNMAEIQVHPYVLHDVSDSIFFSKYLKIYWTILPYVPFRYIVDTLRQLQKSKTPLSFLLPAIILQTFTRKIFVLCKSF